MWTNAEQRHRRTKHHSSLPWWAETVLVLGLALVIALAAKTFVLQAFFIPSGSMEPGLQVNDRIMVQKVSYWTGSPQRGDIVVFKDPGGWLDPAQDHEPGNIVTSLLTGVGLLPSGGHVVKRVIGVGGDTVKCCDRRDRVRVNGYPLAESTYLPPGMSACASDVAKVCRFTIHVPQGFLWLQGDNRENSEDSRWHQDDQRQGMVPVDDVVGKVMAVFWPAGQLGWVRTPKEFSMVPDP